MNGSTLPTVIFFDLGDTLLFNDANNQRRLYADTLDTLQILHQRGYRLGLLSNQAVGATVDQVWTTLSSYGLSVYIERDLVTISTEIPGNVGKPNQPIFDLALQKAGHPAANAQSIFVTETLSHIEAARGYGWRAILKRNSGVCQPAEGECVSGLAGLLSVLPQLAPLDGTNLHLAPPTRLVDGLWAVPVDIARVTAVLTFDGAATSATGDATLEFKLGANPGNPIFDLRQTITAAWLDGASLP
ncbi:MAG: HAD family hydrolase, partial [Anaerolineales bacterium]